MAVPSGCFLNEGFSRAFTEDKYPAVSRLTMESRHGFLRVATTKMLLALLKSEP
jgi:hypothetical protein